MAQTAKATGGRRGLALSINSLALTTNSFQSVSEVPGRKQCLAVSIMPLTLTGSSPRWASAVTVSSGKISMISQILTTCASAVSVVVRRILVLDTAIRQLVMDFGASGVTAAPTIRDLQMQMTGELSVDTSRPSRKTLQDRETSVIGRRQAQQIRRTSPPGAGLVFQDWALTFSSSAGMFGMILLWILASFV